MTDDQIIDHIIHSFFAAASLRRCLVFSPSTNNETDLTSRLKFLGRQKI